MFVLFRSIEQIVEQLGRQINEETFEMVVSRSTVLDNALRRLIKPTFDPKKKLKVCALFKHFNLIPIHIR